jgi:cell wall assembly regulator SMI1
MSNIEQFIKNIESFGNSLSDLGFQQGAKSDQINEVERVIKRKLPLAFQMFLKRINGQYSDKFYFLPDEALLFSCEEIIAEYNLQMEYFEDTIEFYNVYQFNDKIRRTVWSESRIPIAGRDGYYLFLDFDPGPNGSVGQIIFLINECDFVVLATDFSNFIDLYNELIITRTLQIRKIENGKYVAYRLTTDSDFLDGQDFKKLFGQ